MPNRCQSSSGERWTEDLGMLSFEGTEPVTIPRDEFNEFLGGLAVTDKPQPVKMAGVIVDANLLRPYAAHLQTRELQICGKITEGYSKAPTLLLINGGDRFVACMGLQPDTVQNIEAFVPKTERVG